MGDKRECSVVTLGKVKGEAVEINQPSSNTDKKDMCVSSCLSRSKVSRLVTRKHFD